MRQPRAGLEGPVSRLRIKMHSPGMWELDDILFSGERVPLGRCQASCAVPQRPTLMLRFLGLCRVTSCCPLRRRTYFYFFKKVSPW